MVRLIRALGNQDGLNVLQLPPPPSSCIYCIAHTLIDI